MFVLKNCQSSKTFCSTQKIEKDSFIHGWMMLDPLKDFIYESVDNPDYKNFKDVSTWLLNLADKYHCTNLQNIC